MPINEGVNVICKARDALLEILIVQTSSITPNYCQMNGILIQFLGISSCFFVFLFLQEAGRRALWSVNGPRILQVGYKAEENVQVMQAYERVSSLVGKSTLFFFWINREIHPLIHYFPQLQWILSFHEFPCCYY